MTPAEREAVAKKVLRSPIAVNNESPTTSNDDTDDSGADQAREVRNKYLKRIGVGDGGNNSDSEPLLN